VEAAMTDYPAPVDKLLALGGADSRRSWPDYVARFGLTVEHVPDLIRMATDPELNLGDPKSDGVWAPLHAWRALGQLRAEAAVEPLLRLLTDEESDDDWAYEELPDVLGMIGPAALPALETALSDVSVDTYARAAVARAFVRIAADYPATRERSVELLSRELERPGNPPELCGFILGSLLDLKAVEAAPVIERAFAAGRIDESIAGDWPEAQYELGLADEPPPRKYVHPASPWDVPPLPGDVARPSPSAKARAKQRRKEAKKSRKRNRKKK
jgi:hypothetical protein